MTKTTSKRELLEEMHPDAELLFTDGLDKKDSTFVTCR